MVDSLKSFLFLMIVSRGRDVHEKDDTRYQSLVHQAGARVVVMTGCGGPGPLLPCALAPFDERIERGIEAAAHHR